jgi:hypothetical protein
VTRPAYSPPRNPDLAAALVVYVRAARPFRWLVTRLQQDDAAYAATVERTAKHYGRVTAVPGGGRA